MQTWLLEGGVPGAGLGELARRLTGQRVFVESIEPKMRSLARSIPHFSWLNATVDWLQRKRDEPSSAEDGPEY
jgi:hypothetical protein